MALYPKVVLVALPSAAGAQALLRPVAGFVRRVLVLADQDFSFGEMHCAYHRLMELPCCISL